MQIVRSEMTADKIEKTILDCLSGENKYTKGDPNDSNRFCVFAGQYVTERQHLWKETGANFTLFSTEEDSITACDGSSKSGRNRVRVTDVDLIFLSTAPRLGGKPIHPIFQTANYVGGALQTTNFNYTTSQWAVPSTAYRAGDLNRSVFFADGRRAGSFDVPDTAPEDPASQTITYDGIELTLMGCADCIRKNHREAKVFKDGSAEIPIPGLYPRWIDIQQGGPPGIPDIGSCLTFDPGGYPTVASGSSHLGVPVSNWATHGDRYGVDLYNWGGGIAPFTQSQDRTAFFQAHTVGYYGTNVDPGPTSRDVLPLLPTLGVCLVDAPDRCNAQCDMAHFESTVAASAAEALIGVALAVVPGGEEIESAELVDGTAEAADGAAADGTAAVADEAAADTPRIKLNKKKPYLFTRRNVGIGLMVHSGIQTASEVEAETSRVLTGSSVYDVASETDATLSIRNSWKELFNARLATKPLPGSFVFFTGQTNLNGTGLLKFFKNYPTMIRACLATFKNSANKCVGDPGPQSLVNPKSDGFRFRNGVSGAQDNLQSAGAAWDATQTNDDWKDCTLNNFGPANEPNITTSFWAGRTSMLETTPLGIQLGCHVAAGIPGVKRAGSGRFKLSGKFVQPVRLDMTTVGYEAGGSTETPRPNISFNIIEQKNVKNLFDGTLYTALDAEGNPYDMMATFGPTGLCGLCGNIGAAADTSPVRSQCEMGKKRVRYDIQDSLGVYDIHANTWFKERGLYDPTVTTEAIRFTYFDVIGNTSDTFLAASATGETPIERLLGVNLQKGPGPAYKTATTRPPCIGDLQAAVVPYCEIDTKLFHRSVPDSPVCTGGHGTKSTTCPNPRWSNDFRVTFPAPVSEKAVPPPSAYDFDPRAEKLSYCASGPWDFSNPDWYLQPPSGTEAPGEARAPVPYPPSLFNSSLDTFVRCASDLKTPAVRKQFCAGNGKTLEQQGYITTFGVRAGVRSKIGDLCHRTGGQTVKCIVYANQTVGNFKLIQNVIDAFPDADSTVLEIVAVPVAARVVENLLMFMTDVSTLYYNDPSDARLGPDAYIQGTDADHGSVLGRAMGISYDMSGILFDGLCHARPSVRFFAALYAAVEHFRGGENPDSFKFLNFDGLTGAASRGLDMVDDQVYPTHVESRINFGSRQVTLRSAFDTGVAAAATRILQSGEFGGDVTERVLPARHFRIGGMNDPTHGCTRILVQQANATILGIEFRQGGICTRLASESERVPVVAGGSRAVNLRIGSCVCVDCAAGILSARGGDPQLGTDEVGANVDVEGAIVFDTRYLLSAQNAVPSINTAGTCDPTVRLSVCQNASLPGVEAAFARIVGNPVIRSCPTERGDGNLRLVSEYCDVVMKYPPITVREGQFRGSPIASNQSSSPSRDVGCSSACPEAQLQYNALYGTANLLPCCDGRTEEVFYTCDSSAGVNYTRTNATVGDECSYRNCLWNRMTNPDARPQWIDVDPAPNPASYGTVGDDPAGTPPPIDIELCRTFYRMCEPGACPISETECARCAANKTFWPLCALNNMIDGLVDTTTLPPGIDVAELSYADKARNFQNNSIPPPCAETDYAIFTDNHVVVSTAPAAQFAQEILADVIAENAAGQLCSILGCPTAVSHMTGSRTGSTASLLNLSLPVCVVNTAKNAAGFVLDNLPLQLRQVWTVPALDGTDGLGPPPLGEPVDISSAGIPTSTMAMPFQIQAATLDAPGVADPAFFILDTYGTLGGSGVFTAQIAVADRNTAKLDEIVNCVSRQATTTATGTEAGGPLEIRPCSATDPFQAFEFVLHRQLNRWRIQVPNDPFLCLTLQTTGHSVCTEADANFVGNSSTRRCPTTISNTTVPAGAVPVVLPCFPCSVGVDTTGTGSGPVVSSVLTLPSISIGDFAGLPEGRNFENTRQIPLSTTNVSLALTVNLLTGLCFRLAPTLVAAGGIFGPTETTGTQTVDEVPCSLLEGAPIAQLEAVGGPDVCTHAAGLLVAACDAATGGLVLVDGTSDQVKALCTLLGSNTVEVVGTTGGRGAFVNCTRLQGGTETTGASSYTQSLEVVVGGVGYRDNDILRAADPNSTAGAAFDGVAGTFHGFIAKAVWQPSESSESVASSPVVGPTIEVLNVSRIFDIFGEDRLFTIFAASVSSATAAYIVFGIECAVIFTAVVYHLVVFYGGGKRKGQRRGG